MPEKKTRQELEQIARRGMEYAIKSIGPWNEYTGYSVALPSNHRLLQDMAEALRCLRGDNHEPSFILVEPMFKVEIDGNWVEVPDAKTPAEAAERHAREAGSSWSNAYQRVVVLAPDGRKHEFTFMRKYEMSSSGVIMP